MALSDFLSGLGTAFDAGGSYGENIMAGRIPGQRMSPNVNRLLGSPAAILGENPAQQPVARETPREDSPLKKFLGNLGDVFLAGAGADPIYRPEQQRKQFTGALSEWIRNPNDDTFQGMMINPDYAKIAMELRNKDQTYRNDRLEHVGKLEDRAMQALGSAHDQASYDRARNIVNRLFSRFNVSADDLGLPEVFSPQALEEVRLRGTTPKDQLGNDRLNRRLDWDIEDDQLDNERMDDREASLARDRAARLTETRRYNQRRDATIRRGQDRRPAPRSSSGVSARPTATDANGRKVQWNGQAWVPVQ